MYICICILQTIYSANVAGFHLSNYVNWEANKEASGRQQPNSNNNDDNIHNNSNNSGTFCINFAQKPSKICVYLLYNIHQMMMAPIKQQNSKWETDREKTRFT